MVPGGLCPNQPELRSLAPFATPLCNLEGSFELRKKFQDSTQSPSSLRFKPRHPITNFFLLSRSSSSTRGSVVNPTVISFHPFEA